MTSSRLSHRLKPGLCLAVAVPLSIVAMVLSKAGPCLGRRLVGRRLDGGGARRSRWHSGGLTGRAAGQPVALEALDRGERNSG